MNIRLLVSRVGHGFAHESGQVVNLEDREAQRLIETGQAEPIATPESATVAAPESAARPRPTKRTKHV